MVSVATFNSIVKNGGVPTLILISHQRVILDNKTWYQINANTQNVYLKNKHLIYIFMNINANIPNEETMIQQ